VNKDDAIEEMNERIMVRNKALHMNAALLKVKLISKIAKLRLYNSVTKHVVAYEVEVEVEVNILPSVSRPVCLRVTHPSGTRDQFSFLLEIFFTQLRVCYFVAPSLTRGRVCNLLYNCFWALPEQSLFL
jgi:hypothetical protein